MWMPSWTEFCRHFEVGDRRVRRLVEAQAELIGHAVDPRPADPLPAGRDRRAPRVATPPPSPVRSRYAPRTVAAAIDTVCICSLALVASRVAGVGFWPAAGAAAITYQTAATVVTGSTIGTHVVAALRTHAPTLFSMDVARKQDGHART